MIAQLTGNFLHKSATRLVIDVNGVGYEVNISLNTYGAIANASSGTLLTHLKVSEDSFTLYGFNDIAEKEMFLKLLSVSGVGASTARMMLSSLKPSEIQLAIGAGNVKLLESIKGIGKKTAERIALELRDKIGILPSAGTGSFTLPHNTPEAEALEGLMALGIGRAIAEQALKKVNSSGSTDLSVENLIKQALKSI